jgi:hypothetical protein
MSQDEEILVVSTDDRTGHHLLAPNTNMDNNMTVTTTGDFIDRLSKSQRQVLGITLSCLTGLFYGQCFTPVIYTGERTDNRNYIDFLFAFYTGIFLTTLLYFIIYCVLKKNQPLVYGNLILPGLVSGWMWGLADVCYFLATGVLSQAIAFPISNCGPPLFSAMWGVLVYKEVNDLRSFVILLTGGTVAISASIFLGFSF